MTNLDTILKLNPGDTLVLDSGIYTDPLPPIPSGLSWAKPITISALPNTVTFRPKADRVVDFVNARFIVLQGIALDASLCQFECVKIGAVNLDPTSGVVTGASNHIRLLDCEIFNAAISGVEISPECNYNELIGCRIHHNGRDAHAHGAYCESWYNLIDTCELSDNSGHGVQIYNGWPRWHSRANLVQNNKCHHNGIGIGIYTGMDNQVLHNQCWANGVGITLDNVVRTVLKHNRSWGSKYGPAANYMFGPGATETIQSDNLAGIEL